MATCTSTGSDDWSAAGTWDGDVPVNGDTVIIDTGHEVTFDVDQSGFANGVDLTVTGTLTCSTGAGDYYLMCSADIDGAGTLQAGSSGTALPSTVTFTIDFNSAGNSIELAGGLSLLLYCTQPTNTIIELSAQEAAAQTELSVDTDVTADIWAAGDTVRIDDINAGVDSEERVIDSIAAGAITVTAGITNQKESGALVILITRNIKIIGSTDYAIRQGSGAIVGAEISGCTNGIYYGSGHAISGTVSGCTNGIYYGSGHAISGTVSGCTYGIIYGFGHAISGTVSGCTYGIIYGFSPTISGTVSGCNYGLYYGSGHTITGVTFSGSTRDLYRVPIAHCYNTLFGGTTEHSGYNSVDRIAWHYVDSQDHDQVTDAFKAWCRGGIVTSQTASPPTGYTIYYEHACEDADYPCFRQLELIVEAGETLRVAGQMRIENAKDHTAYKPRLQIIDVFSDPLVDSGNSVLDESQVTTAVGDGSTWQPVAVSWQNTGNCERKVLVRMIAKNADSDVDEVWDILRYPQVGAFGGAWK